MEGTRKDHQVKLLGSHLLRLPANVVLISRKISRRVLCWEQLGKLYPPMLLGVKRHSTGTSGREGKASFHQTQHQMPCISSGQRTDGTDTLHNIRALPAVRAAPRSPFGRHLRDAALISRHSFSPQQGALLPRVTAVSQRGSGLGSVPAALGAESCHAQKPHPAICGTFRHDVSLGCSF